MNLNHVALLTIRSENINLLTLLSNLAGSILGLISTIGFVMNLYEGKVEEFMHGRSLKHNLKKVAHYRRHLVMLNFREEVKKMKISKPLYSRETHSIELPVFETCRLSSHEGDGIENEILENRGLAGL